MPANSRLTLGHPFALAGLAMPFLLDLEVPIGGRTVNLLPDIAAALLVVAASWRIRDSQRQMGLLRGLTVAVLFLEALLFLELTGAPGTLGFVALDLAAVLVWVAVVWALVRFLVDHAGDRQLVTWAVFARGLFAAQGAANWIVSLVLLVAQGTLRDPTSVTWHVLTAAILVYVAGVFFIAASRVDPSHPLDLSDRPHLRRPIG